MIIFVSFSIIDILKTFYVVSHGGEVLSNKVLYRRYYNACVSLLSLTDSI
jgi:hypothetical protein